MNFELIRATAECLNLHDISLADHSVKLGVAFDAMGDYPESTLNITYGPREGKLATLQSSDGVELRRWSAVFGARVYILKGEFETVDPKSIPSEHLLADIDVAFTSQFFIKSGSEVSQEGLDEFTRHNVVHIVWPYLREYIQSVCARSRLPIINLHVSMPSNAKRANGSPSVLKDSAQL